MDVVTTMSDPTIPLTALEYDEWGNPDNFEFYKYMLSYSPYDNIRADRISAYADHHRASMIHASPTGSLPSSRPNCVKMKTDNNLLLLQTNYASGHAGSSGRYDYLKEVAVDYAFLIDRLCGHTAPADQRQEVIRRLLNCRRQRV